MSCDERRHCVTCRHFEVVVDSDDDWKGCCGLRMRHDLGVECPPERTLDWLYLNWTWGSQDPCEEYEEEK